MGRVRKKARRSESFFSYAMVTPTVVVLLVMSVFALIFTFYYSFTDYYYISLEGPVFNGLDNYIALFKDSYFIRAIQKDHESPPAASLPAAYRYRSVDLAYDA